MKEIDLKESDTNQARSEKNRAALSDGKVLVGYLLAGYPSRRGFLSAAKGCEAAGLDVLEIGYPAKNPCSDGAVIQEAHLAADQSVREELEYWKEIRSSLSIPIWLMAYKEDLIDSGFYQKLAEAGVIDALVIPDMTCEERMRLLEEVSPLGVDVLGFTDPEMSTAEQEHCFRSFPLVYHQLYAGPTGMNVTGGSFEETLRLARNIGGKKVFAGFGISSPERVSELIGGGFDGAIVGTAMIRKGNSSEAELFSFVEQLKRPVEEINRGAIEGVGRGAQ